MSTISGMFGGLSPNVEFSVDSSNMKIATVEGTKDHSNIGNPIVTLGKIKNPSYVGNFSDFTI